MPSIAPFSMPDKALDGYSMGKFCGQRYLVPDFVVDEVAVLTTINSLVSYNDQGLPGSLWANEPCKHCSGIYILSPYPVSRSETRKFTILTIRSTVDFGR